MNKRLILPLVLTIISALSAPALQAQEKASFKATLASYYATPLKIVGALAALGVAAYMGYKILQAHTLQESLAAQHEINVMKAWNDIPATPAVDTQTNFDAPTLPEPIGQLNQEYAQKMAQLTINKIVSGAIALVSMRLSVPGIRAMGNSLLDKIRNTAKKAVASN